MKRSIAILLVIFCIKVCFFGTLAITFLNGVVEKYNVELRGNLSKDSVVDPSWNPNDLLIKGWAPVLSSYPEIKSDRLPRRSLGLTEAVDHDDSVEFTLPIQSAPINLPIRPAVQP